MMNPTLSLVSGEHLKTYEKIFQHPVSHNLGWREVRSLFLHIGHVVEKPNGSLLVTRNGLSLFLHPTLAKDVADIDDLMKMRHFLEKCNAESSGTVATEAHFLLVIDHREARIYRTEMAGTVPQKILPHDPDDYFRHAHNSKDFSRGQEKPDPNSFFEPVAKALKEAARILIFGSGKGTSNEMDQFITWLKLHHPLLAERIVGSLVVDEHHLTEGQLLEKARGFYAAACLP